MDSLPVEMPACVECPATNWVDAWVHPPQSTGKKVASSDEDLEIGIYAPTDSTNKRLEDKATS